MELPWTEKYRPVKLDEMVGQEAIVERLAAYVKARSMPHLLFAGPAGSGKTTATLCLVRELFGDISHDFLELNASDERGIDVVRTKIRDFARTRPITGDFKIIFLDEADALTPDAQNALRRTMENYTQTCRFIMSCNYSSKIIEPIQSRCSIFRFRKLSRETIKKRLEFILKKENVEYAQDGLEAIAYIAEGDIRHAVNILQSAATLGKVDEKNVYSTSASARPEDVRNVMQLALSGKFLDARNLVDKMITSYGMSGEDILIQMNREAMNLGIPDETKVRIIDYVGEANFTLVEGANERIQLEALLARIMLLKNKS
ncbi:MAG: replication factor C small subunit [Candidatus Altiarchaeota archaeon]|nr:replication factor C small subunit [Candidatus Altiarchaeota archaeon]